MQKEVSVYLHTHTKHKRTKSQNTCLQLLFFDCDLLFRRTISWGTYRLRGMCIDLFGGGLLCSWVLFCDARVSLLQTKVKSARRVREDTLCGWLAGAQRAISARSQCPAHRRSLHANSLCTTHIHIRQTDEREQIAYAPLGEKRKTQKSLSACSGRQKGKTRQRERKKNIFCGLCLRRGFSRNRLE